MWMTWSSKGAILKEHNDRLDKVFQRVWENGLKLNFSKCQFGVQEKTFLGDKMTVKDIDPDETKTEAIVGRPHPTD